MTEKEFVIVVTHHRFLGNIFLPYLIRKEDKFYTVIKLVKSQDIDDLDYNFRPYEKQLVELMDKYSDEQLMKRFSRAPNVSEFFSMLDTSKFQKQISPFLEQIMWEVSHLLMLTPVRLLNKEVKYSNLYDEDEIRISPFFAKPVFYFKRFSAETQYKLKIFLNEREIPLLNRKFRIVSNSPCLLIFQNQLIVFEKLDSKKLLPFFSKEFVSIPHSIEDKYYAGFIRKTIRDFDVVAEGFQLEESEVEKKAVLALDKNLKYEPCFVLRFRYGNEQFFPNANREVAVHFKKTNDEILFKKIKRDKVWEKFIMNYLHLKGLIEIDGFYFPQSMRLSDSTNSLYFLINWINSNKSELEKEGVIIEQVDSEKKFFTGEQNLEIKTDTSGDWFDVFATVTFGAYSFPFIRLKNHILNGIREFELPNGEVAIIPEEWLAKYKIMMPFARSRADKMQFGKHYFALLQDILLPDDNLILNKFLEVTGTKGINPLPKDLNAELRTYQKTGFQWMFFLHKYGFGGCLADDMGLGKTLQTLALLLKLKRPETVSLNFRSRVNNGQLNLFDSPETDNMEHAATLIVMPTSLVHNWEAEIRKFTPTLNVYKHIGQQRKTGSEMDIAVFFYDIILTTYGTVRNDVDTFSRFKFFYLILDESQYVKNPLSKTYKAVMSLQSAHRMALTGTPIENSLSDLWAQMNFLNKGLLGNLAFFRRFFITPIEKHNNTDQKEKLKVLIRPFFLRRTKDEVAKDLPPLMEQVIMCNMEEKQRINYETEKSIIRNSILAGIEHDGIKKSAIVILQGLTRLRQLANHPKLLEDLEETESGKFDEIFRMLGNVIAENHKVLIFSSFVKHLVLIKKQIERERWKYSMLTGQTTQRGEIIKQFQNDPDIRIFLISLKAGGVGLNLTSADYVFIVDPWWNPASENQAISRAHRIGQDKHVFVYRFITQGTIEEKIQQLQNRKNLLADKLINSNNPLQKISKAEVKELFQ